MKNKSSLSPKAYLAAMKNRMSSHFAWGRERFTGIFLGPVFSVTHHANYEWNRRVTSEASTALGIVKKTPEGCCVRYICLRGMLAPTQFLFWFVIVWLITGLMMQLRGVPAWGMSALVTLIFLAILAPITAFSESRTEQGMESMNSLMSLLLDPEKLSF